MSVALTADQVNQVVSNTTLVLLVRPDLIPEWRSNLIDLLNQIRQAALDEEAIFVAAVLSLLHSPNDTLPTGTVYDHAWQTILVGLQRGEIQTTVAAAGEETITIERLLGSVAEALVAVMAREPQQREALVPDLAEMRAAALEAGVLELRAWLDDALALLSGTPAGDLGAQHSGIYAAYWQAVLRSLTQ